MVFGYTHEYNFTFRCFYEWFDSETDCVAMLDSCLANTEINIHRLPTGTALACTKHNTAFSGHKRYRFPGSCRSRSIRRKALWHMHTLRSATMDAHDMPCTVGS
jgi:hypothetical protein